MLGRKAVSTAEHLDAAFCGKYAAKALCICKITAYISATVQIKNNARRKLVYRRYHRALHIRNADILILHLALLEACKQRTDSILPLAHRGKGAFFNYRLKYAHLRAYKVFHVSHIPSPFKLLSLIDYITKKKKMQ